MDGEESKYEEIRQFFSEEEFREMPEYLKFRNVRMYTIYLALKDLLGENTPNLKPDFMKKPVTETVTQRTQNRPVAVKRKRNCPRDENKENFRAKISKEVPVRKNPKRNVPKKSYVEPEVPDLDRYVYCDTCEKECVDFCKTCGAPTCISDEKVPMGVENRAKLTVPKGILEIKASKIHGLGVFALKDLAKGMRFGPYEGKIQKIDSSSGYVWKLRGYGLIDGADEKNSNWLRFINSPNHSEEQNLVAFQYKGNIYYRTAREVEKGEELLVYYGEEYSNELGLRGYFEPKSEEIRRCYPCLYCCLGYSEKRYQERHLIYCKENPSKKNCNSLSEVFTCRYCNVGIGSEKLWNNHEKYCRWIKNRNVTEIGDVVEKNEGAPEDDGEKFKCKVCNYKTKYIGNLGLHLKIHTKEKVYKCRMCCFKSDHYLSLKIHMNSIHTKEIKYSCEKCKFVTFTMSSLNVHMRIHSKKKHFQCSICKVGFNQKISLTEHSYKHTDKSHWPFFCTYCDYVTLRKSGLNSHINSKHTRKVFYSCDNCEYQSTRQSVLNQHKWQHSNVKKFNCQFCSYGCNKPECLRNHMMKNHADKR